MTWRTAVRSRVLLLLVGLVTVSVLLLPLIIRGDGTALGLAQLYLDYAFGWSMALLSAAAVWAGAGAVSLEIEHRTIHMLATKPVRSLELWLGKWLGLMAVNGLLVVLAASLIYAGLSWVTRPGRMSAADRATLTARILTAHEWVPPVAMNASGGHVAGPGQTLSRHFVLSPKQAQATVLYLRYRFSTSEGMRSVPVAGTWVIRAIDGRELFRQRDFAAQFMDNLLRLPPPLRLGRGFSVEYTNQELQKPLTVVFSATDGLGLLAQVGCFEGNYVRAWLLVLCRLGFFSALGLTAGCLFSFPVAAFVSFALLFMTALCRFIERVAARGLPGDVGLSRETPLFQLWDGINRLVFKGLNVLLPPLPHFNPLDYISQGMMIDVAQVGQAFGVLIGGYGVALGLLGWAAYARRELGLPTE